MLIKDLKKLNISVFKHPLYVLKNNRGRERDTQREREIEGGERERGRGRDCETYRDIELAIKIMSLTRLPNW